MKKVSEKRAVNLPKLAAPPPDSGGGSCDPMTPRRPPRLQMDASNHESNTLTPISIDAFSSPTKQSQVMMPTTPSKQIKPQSLRRKLVDADPNSPPSSSSATSPMSIYDPNSSALLNPAFEVDMASLEAEVDKMKQLGQAAEGHVEAIYANNAKERMFFKQVSSEMANMESDIVARQRQAYVARSCRWVVLTPSAEMYRTQEKQAWAAEKVEFESLLAVKDTELHANERERAKLSDTLTQTMQYFTHEVESRDARIATHVLELQTTREVLGSTEHSLRQSQLQHQRVTDALAKHVDELDVTRKEVEDCRAVIGQHEVTIANQSKHILATEAALTAARTAISALETKCSDQKGTLHAYKEEMHTQAYNMDQLRRDVKQNQDKQDELSVVIKTHEKTIAAFKRMQSKWEATKTGAEAEQNEHRAMTKMHKERIEGQAKVIRRQEDAIVAATMTHMADMTAIDMQVTQLGDLRHTVADQAAYIGKLEATCRAAEIQHMKNRSLIELLQTKIHGMEDVASRQDKEIGTLTERLAKRDALVVTRDADVDKLKASYESMSKELLGQVEAGQAAIGVHIGVIDAMRAAADQLTTANKTLTTDLESQTALAADRWETLQQLRREFATSEDNYINLSLQRSIEESHYKHEMRAVATWAHMTIDELQMQLAEKARRVEDAIAHGERQAYALHEIIHETEAAFAVCKAQFGATEADYVAKVQERSEALDEQEERIHLLEIQLKMNAEQALQRRQTAADERQREMAQFQMQLKGKEDVFEIQVSRLKTQIQLERTLALKTSTAAQEQFELDVSKLQSQLQQERTTSVATITDLNERLAAITRAFEVEQDALVAARAKAYHDNQLAWNRLAMLDEELLGRDRALEAAAALKALLLDQHTKHIEALGAEHRQFVAAVHADHADAVDQLQRAQAERTLAHATEAAAATMQFQADLAALQARHAEETAARTEDAQRTRLELEAKLLYQKETMTGQIKAMRQDYDGQLVEQRVRLECLIDHQRETLESQLRELKTDTDAADASQRAKYEAQLAAQRNDYDDQLAKQKAGYESVMSQQRERYDTTIRTRKERYETELASQRADLESTLAWTKTKLEGEVADTTLRLETELRTVKTHLESELASQKEFLETQLRVQRETLDTDIREQKAASDARLASVTSTLQAEVAGLEDRLKRQRDAFDADNLSQRAAWDADLTNQRMAWTTALADQRDTLERETQRQKMEYEDEIRRLRSEYEATIRTDRASYEEDIASTRLRLETARADETAALEAQLAAQQASYERAAADQKADLEGRLAALATKYDVDMAALRAGLEATMLDQWVTFETELQHARASFVDTLTRETTTRDETIQRQRDTFEAAVATHEARYERDMAAQMAAHDAELAMQTAALHGEIEAQRRQLEDQIKDLVLTSEQERLRAVDRYEALRTTTTDKAAAAAREKARLDDELSTCQEQLRSSQQNHVGVCTAYATAVTKHQEASEQAAATIASLTQAIASLEAQVAQCYTGEFILSRIKDALTPQIQPQYHPNIASQCSAMSTLEDLEALIVRLLALAVETQTVIKVGSTQSLGIDAVASIVDEHDILWGQLANTAVKDIHRVIRAVHENEILMTQLPLLVPDLAEPSLKALLGYITTYQTLRRDAASVLQVTNTTTCLNDHEIVAALQAWQSCRTNVARALRCNDLVCSEKDMLAFIDEYMGLRDKACHRFLLDDVDAAALFDRLDAYQTCLTQGKVILAKESVDTATLLAHMDDYEQLRNQVSLVAAVKKDSVDGKSILGFVQDYFKLRAGVQRVLVCADNGAGAALPTSDAIVVEEYQTLRTHVGGIWATDAAAAAPPRILSTLQDLQSFRQDVAAVLQTDLPPPLSHVVKQLQEFMTLRRHAAKLLQLADALASPKEMMDAIDTFQTLRGDCGRLWTVGDTPRVLPPSAKEVLTWVQEYHGVRTRVSILLGRESICTADDVVQVVQTYLDLTVKHRDLVRAKMTIEANNNALQGTVDSARQQLSDYELRLATLGAKHACPFQATTAAVFFDALDHKLQDGKDFELAFHRRKQMHEQDNAQHATAVDAMTREAAITLELVHREYTLKLQDLERSSTQDVATLKRTSANDLDDLKRERDRAFADLERTTAAKVDALERDIVNVRAIKLKEQEDYDATMDKIRRGLEVQVGDASGRKDQSEKATYFARYVERDRMLMELVYGSIRSVTQLLTPAKTSFVLPTEMSHAILGCIKELKRMKEYVMGSFDALQKDVAPFLPFEVKDRMCPQATRWRHHMMTAIQWYAVEWRPEMDLAQWCVECAEKTNEYARAQFHLFLAQANTTLTLLAATQRERAMDVLAFMRRSVLQDDASQEKDVCMLKMRLMDAVTDRDQVGMELQLKETFFADLLHQHKAIAADMQSRLAQHQQMWKSLGQGSGAGAAVAKLPAKASAAIDATLQKPTPKPKWQQEDTTTLLSNGRTLKERFVSDLALETGQNPAGLKRGFTMQTLQPSPSNAARKISQPYVPMQKMPPPASNAQMKPGQLWHQGVKQVDGHSLSLAIGVNPTQRGLVVDVFNSDTECMQAIDVNATSTLLMRYDKPLVDWTPAERAEVVDAVLARLHVTSHGDQDVQFGIADDVD
ncbi:Aste57867_8082 [Aphanomyces stellatus]|uniref:Aste57867_8082 protein n=1 Tax=Aphanomyces stellatus TaxID=120398 RepID=A0A485KJB0_9STRA|nr:hypothetical protein As57867_008052 [Aphanomyces stellatus]VFT84971.1 Aste57867_8082 [Aphanomyces stellatus]